MKHHSWLFFIFLAMIATSCTSNPKTSQTATLTIPTATVTPAINPPTSTVPPTLEPVENEPTPTSQVLPSATPSPTQPAQVATQPSVTETVAQVTPSPTPTSLPENTPVPPTPGTSCTDQATFEGDVTIPDNTVFDPGEKFVKTWRLYNSGTCTWGAGYAVIFAYGDAMGAPASSAIPPAAPGTSIQISLDMTAPVSPGQHAGNWQLQNGGGQHFGVGMNGSDYFWAQVMVSYAATVTPAGATAPAPAATTEAPPPGGSNPTPSPAPTSSTSGGCTYSGNPGFENEILQQINSLRTSHGLGSLVLQSQLSAAALTYSIDMACNNRVDFTHHTDSSGGRWYQRIATQGYDYAAAFENVYVGNPAYGGTPQEAINWWMNSPIHRANILNPDVTEIGIAYAYTSASDFGGYYTVDFAQPK